MRGLSERVGERKGEAGWVWPIGHNGVVWCRAVGNEFEGGQADPLGGRPKARSKGVKKRKQRGPTPLTPGKSDPGYWLN